MANDQGQPTGEYAMGEQGAGDGPYEDWGAVMAALLSADAERKQVAFLKIDRLVAGCLMALQA